MQSIFFFKKKESKFLEIFSYLSLLSGCMFISNLGQDWYKVLFSVYILYFSDLRDIHAPISWISRIFTDLQLEFVGFGHMKISLCCCHDFSFKNTNKNKVSSSFQLLNLAPIFKFQNRINFPTPLKKCIHWQNLEQCGWGPWELIETFEIRVETKKN